MLSSSLASSPLVKPSSTLSGWTLTIKVFTLVTLLSAALVFGLLLFIVVNALNEEKATKASAAMTKYGQLTTDSILEDLHTVVRNVKKETLCPLECMIAKVVCLIPTPCKIAKYIEDKMKGVLNTVEDGLEYVGDKIVDGAEAFAGFFGVT